MNQARNVLQFTIWYQITEKGKVMEDRHLFKAKRKDNGEWITGALITCEDETYKIATSCLEGRADEPMLVCAYDVDRDTICQCTGLKDKNGKLIWENDIVECTRGNAIVEWDRVDWKIRWIEESIWRRDLRHWSIDDAEGIGFLGNIFDNPELLESEE